MVASHRGSSLVAVTWPDFVVSVHFECTCIPIFEAVHYLPPVLDIVIITKCHIAEGVAQTPGCLDE